MSTIDPTQLPNLVADQGKEIAIKTYEPETEVWRQIVEPDKVIPPSELAEAPFGEKYLFLVGVGTPTRRHPGQATPSQTMGEGWTIQLAAHEYADKVGIPDELLEVDSRRGTRLVMEFMTSYSRNTMVAKDEHIAGMFNTGPLTAGSATYFDQRWPGQADANLGFGYDGLPWFDTAHPLKHASTTYANHVASRTLTAANLQTTLVTMSTTNAVDERGKRIRVQPRKLVVPPALESTARVILESEQLAGTGNNDINYMRNKLALVVNPYLTDADGWFVTGRAAGLKVVDTGMPMFDTYRDEDAKTTYVRGRYRFGAAVEDWREAFGCNVAAS